MAECKRERILEINLVCWVRFSISWQLIKSTQTTTITTMKYKIQNRKLLIEDAAVSWPSFSVKRGREREGEGGSLGKHSVSVR